MPALDFTSFPSKPAAPPAVSAGAPRQTARAGAPKTGHKAGSSASAGNGEFGQLVDRLSDADEGKASSTSVSTRGSRDAGTIGEEGAAEPRAKGDAEGASGAANDAPAVLASMASTSAPFPWTLPLSPSLWNLDRVQGDGAFAGETGEGEGDGDSVSSAAAAAMTDSVAEAVVATLPGVGRAAETSPGFTIPVETPLAVNPVSTTIAAETAASLSGSQSEKDGSAVDAIDTAAWTGAAGAVGSVSTEAGAYVTEAGDDPLANTYIAAAGQASAAVTGGPTDGVESAIGQSAARPLASSQFEHSSTVDPNDSALVAQSAIDAATMAAAVEDSSATTVAGQTGQTGQTNAAIDGPLPGDQAREQALLELQRALDAARANAPAAPTKNSRNADAAVVIQTGGTAAGATTPNDAADAATAAAHAAAIDAAAANAGDASASATAPTGEAAVGIGALASPSSTSRSRDAKQTSEELSADSATTGASSWAAAAVAKYAEAAGAGTSSGTDTRDSGSSADAAASLTLAGRAGGEAGGVAPIGFDARVVAASRTDSASELPDGFAGESGILTTAAPEEQAAQIVRSMRLQWRGATGEATLRLQPDHLGQVFVSVRVENGTVSATVRAETPAAQQWIQQHQQQLRDALDAQGLRVAQFHVTSNPDDRPRRDHEQEQNQDGTGRRSSRGRARNDDDSDRRFEIHL
jgi:flagellar hook-length control protein FliK